MVDIYDTKTDKWCDFSMFSTVFRAFFDCFATELSLCFDAQVGAVPEGGAYDDERR